MHLLRDFGFSLRNSALQVATTHAELERIRISFLCCPCVPLSRDQGGAQGSEGKQVDPSGRVWYSHLPWHITDSGSTKTPSSRSSAITGGPSSSAIRATRSATCRP